MITATPLSLPDDSPDDLLSILERVRQLLGEPALAPLWRQGRDHYTEISVLSSAGAHRFISEIAMTQAMAAADANVSPATCAAAKLLAALDDALAPWPRDPLAGFDTTLVALRRALPHTVINPTE
jgi:hypothetical protein